MAQATIKEAGATIVCQGQTAAFYNPAQEFNRDLRSPGMPVSVAA